MPAQILSMMIDPPLFGLFSIGAALVLLWRLLLRALTLDKRFCGETADRGLNLNECGCCNNQRALRIFYRQQDRFGQQGLLSPLSLPLLLVIGPCAVS